MVAANDAVRLAHKQDDDAALVARAKADVQNFAPLYARYFDAVYGYCVTRLGDADAAEDATSLIFARALAGLAACRPESFRSWLFAIAHNVVSDRFRRSHPMRPLDAAGDVPDPAPSPEEQVVASERRGALRDLLTELPEDQRRVLELRFAGLTSPEVARVLGRSPTAVRSLQFRAIGRLRALLGHDPGIAEETENA